jgi:Restriction Endonuclease associating with ARP
MGALEQILARQKDWAEVNEIQLDPPGYVKYCFDNLFRPLSMPTCEELFEAAGRELESGPNDKPAKMRALESSSALCCNFFDFWRTRNPGEIGRLLMIPEPVLQVSFEVEFPTGLRGTPPTLDMVLTDQNGVIWGIEAKFCEPYRPKPKRPPFADSYFPDGEGLWASRGLVLCERLARDLHDRKVAFERLDIAQLLKHALGLHSQPRISHLWYLWYEEYGPEAKAIRRDLDVFAQQVDPRLNFHAVTYQEVFESVCKAPDVDADYVKFLLSRYFKA